MFVELHLLQNFAPANLNRDDTGAPKDCEFGGYRRARISSQCLKRTIREHFRDARLLPPERLAVRTKRLVDELADRLSDAGKGREQARGVVEAALNAINLTVVTPRDRPAERRTQYLVYAAPREIDALVHTCLQHWDSLVEVAASPPPAANPNSPADAAQPTGGTRARSSAREAKRAARESVTPAVAADLRGVLDGGKAADLALFGRMLADLPDKNVDAACQVAHAISTNKVGVEFDFYTAVDDLLPEETTGADMLGTVEFNSACFYRYANVDLAQLRANLGGDAELARGALEAFLRASVEAVPTGKQNSMAAQNWPSLVFAVARDSRLCSLANGFVRPVRPGADGDLEDLVAESVGRLDGYWHALTTMYGAHGIAGGWVATLHGDRLRHLKEAPVAHVPGVDQVIAGVLGAVTFDGAAGGAR